jgi:hypothetical protein
MHIRRPLAGLFVALTLFGGSAVLTGCGDPTGANTGTPRDTSSNTSGSAPSSSSQGKLPDNSNREPSASDTGNDVGNG